MARQLVLGSASPRRAQLLAELGVEFTVCAADIDETRLHDEPPRNYVRRMAREKAAALDTAGKAGGCVLLTADTTVVLDGTSFGKPRDRSDAATMLRSLSGREHEVYTAVVLLSEGSISEALVCTRVEFSLLSSPMIERYLLSDEPWDKAGAYALQGLAGSFVRGVTGSVSNVIGLPQVETRELLVAAGLCTWVVSGKTN
ncbi:MAG: nucleoside triphosphate pyrophosphatase [Congregibacter sp.]